MKNSQHRCENYEWDIYGIILRTIMTTNEIERMLKILEERGCDEQSLLDFRKKLRRKKEFEPTLYEIASAVIMSGVFEPDTMEFEKNIPNGKKNSDIYGKFGDSAVRVEVKRIEENWQPKHDENEMRIVESARIAVGYIVTLNNYLLSGEGEAIRQKIEVFFRGLSDKTLKTNQRGDVFFEDHCFCKEEHHDGNHYFCKSDEYPIHAIVFYEDQTIRCVGGPVITQSLMNRHFREDLGIETTDDIDWGAHGKDLKIIRNEDQANNVIETALPQIICFGGGSSSQLHRDRPPATKYLTEIEVKLQQCEEGCINIVVIGNPDPSSDDALMSALHGQPFFSVADNETALCRHPNAPFNAFSQDQLNSFAPEARERISDTINKFRILSAAIGIRIDSHDVYFEILDNPNADIPLPPALKKRIHESYRTFFRQNRAN